MEQVAKWFASGSFWVALCSSSSIAGVTAWDSTSVTNDLNQRIAQSPFNPYDKGSQNPYHGGKGVLVRDLIDTLQNDQNIKVVPSTFWSNDIYSVSNMYPDVDMIAKGTKDVWKFASVGIVIGTGMPTMFYDYDNLQSDDWGYGVFYGRDSNSADIRCRWLESFWAYDCPGGWIDGHNGTYWSVPGKKGAGGYPAGNPYKNKGWGGGAGCHFGRANHVIDQVNAYDQNKPPNNLVQNHDCECTYSVFSKYWGAWVDQWVQNTKDKPTDDPDSFWGDRAVCWVSNIRMMVNMQNWLWWKWQKKAWTEQTGWPGSGNEREYVGWNEVPVDRANVGNPANWDAFVVKLPANVCGKPNYGQTDTPQCLENGAQARLEERMTQWMKKGYIKPGKANIGTRPGAYVVFAQEYKVGTPSADSGNWRRVFFCAGWKGPSGRWEVVSIPISADNKYGACYLVDHSSESTTIV